MRELTFYTFSDSDYLETLNHVRTGSLFDRFGATGSGDWELSKFNVALHTAGMVPAVGPDHNRVEPPNRQRVHVRIHVLHVLGS